MELELKGQFLVIRPKCNLIYQEVTRIKEEHSAEIAATNVKGIIVNCMGSKMLDSSGVGWLTGIFRHMKKKGGLLVVCNMPGNMREILDMMQMDSLIKFAPDEDQAMEMLTIANA